MRYFKDNMVNAFGVDLSRFNTSADGRQKVDFNQLAAHQPRVSFIAMRAGISWAYQDPWFVYYFSEAARIGAFRLPYHVLHPAESARAQMDHFLRIVGEEALGQVRLVLDVELDHQQPTERITDTLLSCLHILQARTGRLPIVYSRAGWVDAHLAVKDLPELDWWMAQYLWQRPYPLYTPEYPCPPLLPKGVRTWLIHQTANRAPAIGSPNFYMDYNRWHGDEAALRVYFGAANPGRAVICPLDGAVCPVLSPREILQGGE